MRLSKKDLKALRAAEDRAEATETARCVLLAELRAAERTKHEVERWLHAARLLLQRTMSLYAPDMVGTASGNALLLDICKWDDGAGASAAPSRPLTYLASPYSHPDRTVRVARFEAANAAAGKLMMDGHKVFSPISHTHPIAECCGLPLGWDFWEAFDRAYLTHCGRVVVLRSEGWQDSKGVQAELRIAAELGIPVEYMDPGRQWERASSDAPPRDSAVLEEL